jgi:hypothetical protein
MEIGCRSIIHVIFHHKFNQIVQTTPKKENYIMSNPIPYLQERIKTNM